MDVKRQEPTLEIMQHLIFSCLESRVEDNGVLFGRYLLGPLRIGQATTVANALRRALLSEVQGVAITAVEVAGAAHPYSSITGVRESALDIVLNLKQVVLSGAVTNDLPAIGYIDMQGPRAVTAGDLMLPTGICCVNRNQLIATLSANGLLKMKFVISAGKSKLTPYTDATHNVSEEIFQPKTRRSEDGELPLYQRKWLRRQGDTPSAGQRHERRGLSLRSKLHKTVWGKENNVVLYNTKRRSDASSGSLGQAGKDTDLLQGSKDSPSSLNNTLGLGKGTTRFARKRETSSPFNLSVSTGATNKGALISSDPLTNEVLENTPETWQRTRPEEANLFSLQKRSISIEAAIRFTKQLGNLESGKQIKGRGKSLFFDKPIETVTPNRSHRSVDIDRFGQALSTQCSEAHQPDKSAKGSSPRSVLPVNPIFAPITRVNFAIQIDEQWQEPRERIVLEVWSNGSIHPRQAIQEAASNLVYLFSLLR